MRPRVLVAKVGFDGHDRGIKIVARTLRDAGMEVIYAGLRQTPTAIAAAARDEDVDVIGLSMHNGAHLTLTQAVIHALHEHRLDTPVVVGGIVPGSDVPKLEDLGVTAVLGPGSSNEDVIDVVRRAAGDSRPIEAATSQETTERKLRSLMADSASRTAESVTEAGGRARLHLTSTSRPRRG